LRRKNKERAARESEKRIEKRGKVIGAMRLFPTPKIGWPCKKKNARMKTGHYCNSQMAAGQSEYARKKSKEAGSRRQTDRGGDHGQTYQRNVARGRKSTQTRGKDGRKTVKLCLRITRRLHSRDDPVKKTEEPERFLAGRKTWGYRGRKNLRGDP